MRKIIELSASMILVLLVFCTCKEDVEGKVAKLEEAELAKGVRFDSLFLGMYFGMPNKDFYTKCWELNKQGLLTAGSGNESATLKTNELKYPATMNFYPTFYNGKICEMPLQFQYDSWAPWVRYTQPDSLQLDVLNLMEKKYGKGFIKIIDKKLGLSYIKIEGNRRIFIHQKPEMFVRVIISDLTVTKALEKQSPKKG